MVTVFIEGPSLQDDVDRNGPLPPDRVYALGAGLAEGLAAIHACGLVHRDLKPGNVVLAADGPRIIDFGIARAIGATTGLTSTGVVVGTLTYMSPEQIRGDAVGPASDVFALGSVLAFAATGGAPFGDDSAVTVMFRICTEPPDLAGVADERLRKLIDASLAKAPQDRPTLPALLAALGGATSATAPAAPARAVPTADAPVSSHAIPAATQMPTQSQAPVPASTGSGREPLRPPSGLASARQTEPSHIVSGRTGRVHFAPRGPGHPGCGYRLAADPLTARCLARLGPADFPYAPRLPARPADGSEYSHRVSDFEHADLADSPT